MWIEAGSEKNVSEFMAEISYNIINILKRNGIYVEDTNIIEQYFMSFAKILNSDSLDLIKRMQNLLNPDKKTDSKTFLNKKLQELDKTIFLIVDDLDRCKIEYQDEMFKVIRESLYLQNCKVLFLIEKGQFIKENNRYMDKYISYTLDLCEVPFESVFTVNKEYILKDEFYENAKKINSNLQNKEIDLLIKNMPEKLLEKYDDAYRNKKDKYDNKTLDIVYNEKNIISKRLNNTRIVKKYLKEIKIAVDLWAQGYESISGSLKKYDWLEAIVEIAAIKIFCANVYNDMKMSKSIKEYCENNDAAIIKDFLQLSEYDNEKENMLNKIVYEINSADYRMIVSERDKFRKKVDSKTMDVEDIISGLKYADNSKLMLDVINTYTEDEGISDRDLQIQFISEFLSQLVNVYDLFSNDKNIFLNISKKLINYVKKIQLSEEYMHRCKILSEDVLRSIIDGNDDNLTKILYIRFGKIDIKRLLGNAEYDNGYLKWYEDIKAICMEFDCLLPNISKYKDKYECVRAFYESVEEDIKNGNRYKIVKIDYHLKFYNIYLALDLCSLWNDFIGWLEDREKDDIFYALNRYLKDNSKENLDMEIVFNSPNNMIDCASIIKNNAIEHKNNKNKIDKALKLLNDMAEYVLDEYEIRFLDGISKLTDIIVLTCNELNDMASNELIEELSINAYNLKKLC